jgi:hypothetical protein
MKYLALICTLFCINHSLYSISDLEQDPEFLEIKKKLDSRWKIYTKKDLLFLERKEPVLVMPESKINSNQTLGETEKEKMERLKKYGMKMKPSISYRFQKRWTVNEMIESEVERENIISQVEQLPKKYKIEYLLDKELSRNGNEIYTPRTKKAKKRIKEYFVEKSKLEKKIPLSPDYHLTKFTLFLISKKGVSSEYAEVYPESVMGEFIQVEKLLFKYKVKQN